MEVKVARTIMKSVAIVNNVILDMFRLAFKDIQITIVVDMEKTYLKILDPEYIENLRPYYKHLPGGKGFYYIPFEYVFSLVYGIKYNYGYNVRNYSGKDYYIITQYQLTELILSNSEEE